MAFIKMRKVSELTGLHRLTIAKLEARGDFPPRVSLKSRSVMYPEEEVRGWMDKKINERHQSKNI